MNDLKEITTELEHAQGIALSRMTASSGRALFTPEEMKELFKLSPDLLYKITTRLCLWFDGYAASDYGEGKKAKR